MQAILLAGGLGTRLRSVVSDRPKPMALIGEKPFMEYVIQELKKQQKPFIVLVNSQMPYKDAALKTAEEIQQKYKVTASLGINFVSAVVMILPDPLKGS